MPNNKYYDANAAIQVIGCVLNNPDLLDKMSGYPLAGIDFSNDFHKVIFGSMLDLYENGGRNFNANIIEDFLKNKDNSLAIYKVNNGAEWLHKTFLSADILNFDYYYNRLKKMTLLRVYNDIGLNLDWLYDPDNILDIKKKQEQNENLDAMNLEELADMIDNRISRAKDMVVSNDMNESIQIGDGLEEFMAHLKDNPLTGYALYDGVTDKIALGARPGCFYLRSAATGTGKSRTSMADACYLACSEIYINGEWVKNENQIPTVFISVELDIEELWTMAIAFVSQVNENKLISRDEEMTFEERERVEKAIEILKSTPLYLEYLPDYTMQDIENCIRRNIREHKARAVFFDYLTSSMSIIQEVTKSAGGMKIREDQVLFLLASKIKDIAGQYRVFICSATQLNGLSRDAKILDQNMLAGAKSIANRIDFGEIMMDVTPNDLGDLEGLLNSHPELPMPNVKSSIYKNRRGKINRVICWMVADKGTCRYETAFVTDYNFNLIEI